MRSKPNAESATPHLIRARTSLIGITQEPDGGVLNTTGIMKELTGGDNIYVRRLYKESEEVYMKTQFIIQTNKTFFVDDTDPAVWSRIRVIKFESHFIDKNEIDETNKYKIDMDILQTFIQKALIKSENNKLKLSEIIKNYNKYINDNHPNVRKLDKRRLEHVLYKIYGNKSIEDDYLLEYNIKDEYNYDIDYIINQLNLNN